jgi:hypothetical protein
MSHQTRLKATSRALAIDMRRVNGGLIRLALVTAVACLLHAGTASAALPKRPVWKLTLSSQPTNLVPGNEDQLYVIYATNIGAGDSEGPITVTDTLPTGVAALAAETGEGVPCLIASQVVTCTEPATVHPGESRDFVLLLVVTASDPSVLTDQATLSEEGEAKASDATATTVSSALAPFDFLDGLNGLSAEFTNVDGSAVSQAGSHPDQLVVDLGFPSFDNGNLAGVGTQRFIGSDGGLRDLTTVLPRGIVVDPGATPIRCTEVQFEGNRCPDSAQVGIVALASTIFGGDLFFHVPSPLYNIVPPPGVPAEFGFNAAGADIFVHVAGGVHPGDYALEADAKDILARSGDLIAGIQVQLWGDPSSGSHDHVRGECLVNKGSHDSCPVTPRTVPLLTMPTACSSSLTITASASSWNHPDDVITRDAELDDTSGGPKSVTGCDKLDFTPEIGLRPTTRLTGAASGMNVDLQIPQTDNLSSLAEANLKQAVVKLPTGMTLNPASANGLTACSEAQIGLVSESPVRFNGAEPVCPESSQVGTVKVTTPILPEPLEGKLYIATQNANPFHTLLAGYMVIQGQGITIKLAGRFELDPNTGAITATFDENPQLPFSDLRLHFTGGDRGVLIAPSHCGSYPTESVLTPWSAPSGPGVSLAGSFTIDQGCDSGGFAPSFVAGTFSNAAGAFSPFVLSFSRSDAQEQVKGLQVTLPPGASAKLAGVPLCSDTDANAGTCPEASRIGSVTAGSGAGPDPLFLKGSVYLTGSYNGGPFGEAVVVPAIAGPFNLGNVVVRGSIRIDPHTAQATVVSDPFPQFVGSTGIPTDVRRVDVTLDRPNFTFNPTNCKELHTAGTLTSVGGASEAVSPRFQAADCRALSFKPSFQASTQAKSSRQNGASLHVVLRSGPGQANIAYAHVSLPKILPSRLTTLQKACADDVFKANPAACPAASRVGEASAITPILAQPLHGPAYFVSHGGAAFPDLVVVLQGEGITVDLVGNTSIKKNVTSSTFASTPDVPVTRFDLTLPAGPNSALAGIGNLCKERQKLTMPTRIVGQNGAVMTQKTKIAVPGCPKAKKPKRK